MSNQDLKERNQALDWVKGALVVLMVVYHSLNYSPYHPLAFKYLAFLPPSFILISGFLITNGYFRRYDGLNLQLFRKLAFRGFKLILLCTVLNLILDISGAAFRGDWFSGFNDFLSNARALYISQDRRTASFYILIPIGYLQMVSPLLLLTFSVNRWLLPSISAVLGLICSILDHSRSLNYHFGMVSAGIIGMAVGSISLEAIGRIARTWWVTIPIYCIYRVCSLYLGNPYPVQIFAIGASLLVIHGLALSLWNPQRPYLYDQVTLLGRYSLFGYIFQLAIIQVVVRILTVDNSAAHLGGVLLLTLLFTWLACLILEKIRSSKSYFDTAYRVVFA